MENFQILATTIGMKHINKKSFAIMELSGIIYLLGIYTCTCVYTQYFRIK